MEESMMYGSSGRVYSVDETGLATLHRCNYLVKVPIEVEAPSCEDDLYRLDECLATIREYKDGGGRWDCDSGHGGWPYGSIGGLEEEADLATLERDGIDPYAVEEAF